jgi:hypothetical protein
MKPPTFLKETLEINEGAAQPGCDAQTLGRPSRLLDWKIRKRTPAMLQALLAEVGGFVETRPTNVSIRWRRTSGAIIWHPNCHDGPKSDLT